MVRRRSSFNGGHIDHLYLRNCALKEQRLFLHHGDITDPNCAEQMVEAFEPDEIYNQAAQSHVKVSFEVPHYTAIADALGTLNFLEAICHRRKRTRFYQTSTNELYGMVQEVPQRETTPFYPRSLYGMAKLYGYWIERNYREAYGLFACNDILFNRESPRRGESFVTRKITLGVALIKLGLQDKLVLGNLEAKRDWGYAPEYVEAMWRMAQTARPDDFVIATGETHSVREFVEEAFRATGATLSKATPPTCGRPRLTCWWEIRPRQKSRWAGHPKVKFQELVRIMVAPDLDVAAREARQNPS